MSKVWHDIVNNDVNYVIRFCLKKDENTMSKKVLNNNAIFKCEKGIGVISAPSHYQQIAKDSGRFILNDRTKCTLMSPGQCTLQPNPSGVGFLPCNQSIVPVLSWQGTDNVIKILGNKALTVDSSTICPLGGKICLQSMEDTIFRAGCSAAIVKKDK